ncbi:MAG: hypothetical protein KJ847_00900, partial [Firmicutes bacterium]|nr:hypothetical protein [Bacillota bacterium]
ILTKYLDQLHTISIIGIAKNAGKTTVLNQLIEEFKGQNIALTSIGLDGEKVDNITMKPKPRIKVYPGMFVATCEACLKECYFEYHVLRKTTIRTPLGNIIVIEVLSEGLALVAGPSTNEDMKKIISIFKTLNPVKILIDGALFRKSIANMQIAEGIFLCTGASYHRDIDIVVHDTNIFIQQLSLPKLSGDIYNIIESHLQYKTVLVDYKNLVTVLKIDTVVGNEKVIVDSLTNRSRYLYVNGGISPLFIRLLIERRHEFESLSLVVGDATQLIIDPIDMQHLKRMNIKLFVIHEIKILAVTYNPTSPFGYQFSNDEFYEKLKQNISYPLINVISDRK